MIKKTDKYKTCQKSAYVRGRRKEKTKKKANNEVLLPPGTGQSEEFTAAGQ